MLRKDGCTHEPCDEYFRPSKKIGGFTKTINVSLGSESPGHIDYLNPPYGLPENWQIWIDHHVMIGNGAQVTGTGRDQLLKQGLDRDIFGAEVDGGARRSFYRRNRSSFGRAE